MVPLILPMHLQPLQIVKNFNKKTYNTSKLLISAETCSITNSAVQDANDDIIVTQPVSRPHSINNLDTHFNVDDDAQSFETPW